MMIQNSDGVRSKYRKLKYYEKITFTELVRKKIGHWGFHKILIVSENVEKKLFNLVSVRLVLT